jgi:hypothetical protein
MFRKNISRLVVVFLMVAIAVGVNRPHVSQAAPNSNPNKITICHRTHATTNPYRRITVNVSSIFNGNPSSSLDDPQANGNGHGRFQHNDWIESEAWFASNKTDSSKARPVPNVYDPNTTYPNNKKRWGDIIPPDKVNGQSANRTAAPLNFTGAGLAIYNNVAFNGDARYAEMCKRRTAKQYCDDEIAAFVAAGMTQSTAERTCMEELAEQGALEDEPLKAACGSDIATCSVSKLAVYGTSTGTASCANGVATLNGSTNMSSVVGEPTFDVGTTTALGTSISASPTTVTGAASFTATYTIPGDGTYYYQAMVTSTDGNESVIAGNVVSLVVSGSSCSVTGAQSAMPTTAPSVVTTTTSTTTPNTSTNTPANSNSVGALTGTVWIDANEDDVKDASEVWIPGIAIAVTGPTGSTTVTSSNGSFNFTNLPPGRYTVTATLPSNLGLRRTWDTQGSADWEVVVNVVAGQTARADYAAVGSIDVIGNLTLDPNENPKPVELDWSGIDKKLDTPDDQTFKPTVNRNGSFTVSNVPTGTYRVRSQSLRVNLAVTSAGTTYNSSKITIQVRPDILPATGQRSMREMYSIAVLLVLAGAVLVSRRRLRRI